VQLVPKVINGGKYWYLQEKEWRDGESHVKRQYYLGSADKIFEMFCASEKKFIASEVQLKTFNLGKPAAFLMAAEELGFEQIISNTVDGGRKRDTAHLMFIMTAGRTNGPMSKLKTVSWFYKRSVLPHLLDLSEEFNEDILYYTMDKLNSTTRSTIGDALCRNIMAKGLTPKFIYEDTTNFATNIEHGGELPQKGKSKEGRRNKNLVGMALAVSDENIPMLFDAYPGNKHDADVFPETMDALIKRLERLKVATEELVLVFDKGNNSEDNLDLINGRFHIIASVKRNQASELMEVSLAKFEYLYTTYVGYKVVGYPTRCEFFGREWRTIVTYNPGTARKQKETYERNKRILTKFLDGLTSKVGREGRGRKMTATGALRQATKKIHNDYVSVFKTEISTEKNWFKWWLDEEAEKALMKRMGKQIVITDLEGEEWASERIVRGYNNKALIEDDFKIVKDTFILPFFPVRHRKDDRIDAHVFLCGIGLTFLRYAMHKLKDTNLSIYQVLEALEGINVSLVKEKKTKRVKWVINQLDIHQSIIFNELGLHRFIPRR